MPDAPASNSKPEKLDQTRLRWEVRCLVTPTPSSPPTG